MNTVRKYKFAFLKSFVFLQSQLNTAQNELQQMKDHTLHQRKRVTEMLTNLLKDLGEVGHVLGNNTVDTKVSK